MIDIMRIESFTDLAVFCISVKKGSLTAAANELGLSLAVASKRLQRIESQLGVRLLNRSTRQLRLTEEGADFFEYAQRILAELEDAEEKITLSSEEPHGTLRVTMPAAFGRLHIAPLVPKFLSLHPNIKLSLHLSDRFVDVVNDGYDVSIRIGDLDDSSLIARLLGEIQLVIVATPSYLEKYGTPKVPQDLIHHNALLFFSSNHVDKWEFIDKKGNKEFVKVIGNLETNNCDALMSTVLSDHGVALRPIWDVWDALESGQLVRILQNYTLPSFPIHAIYPSKQLLPRKTKLFLDFLLGQFRNSPYWEIKK